MINLASNYRIKALICEARGREATEPSLKLGWAEIAIEWHALANRVASGQTLH